MIKFLTISAALVLIFIEITTGSLNPVTCYTCFDSIDGEKNCSSPLDVSKPDVKISACADFDTFMFGDQVISSGDELVCLTTIFGLNFNYPKPVNVTGRSCAPKYYTVAGERVPICEFINMYAQELGVADLKECITCDTTNCNGE